MLSNRPIILILLSKVVEKSQEVMGILIHNLLKCGLLQMQLDQTCWPFGMFIITVGGKLSVWFFEFLILLKHSSWFCFCFQMLKRWKPEALHSTYTGTQNEMHKVQLPPPSQNCVENRLPPDSRCSTDEGESENFGSPEGACDEAASPLTKVIVGNLFSVIHDSSIPEARQSPAYQALKAFHISELQQSAILTAWLDRDIDKYGFDPRYATCEWMADNLEYLVDFIPRSYPRAFISEDIQETALFYVGFIFGLVAFFMVISTGIVTYRRRERKAVKYAQISFLFLVLLGLLMVALAAVLMTLKPNNGICVLNEWLITLGYTLAIVPLIVKVTAINRCKFYQHWGIRHLLFVDFLSTHATNDQIFLLLRPFNSECSDECCQKNEACNPNPASTLWNSSLLDVIGGNPLDCVVSFGSSIP